MSNKQRKMNETQQKFRIKISDNDSQGGNFVLAPLPNDFGFTLANNYTTPFDVGSLGGGLAKANAIYGKMSGGHNYATAPGIGSDKVFTNPEPSEISFDLDFSAYYSTIDEVAVPVLELLRMTAVDAVDYDEGMDMLGQILGTLKGAIGMSNEPVDLDSFTNNSTDKTGSKIMGILNFMKGPGKVNVHFGEVFTIIDAFVSSLSVQFSNKVDAQGIPLSAKCSVTLALEHVPTNKNVAQWFERLADVSGFRFGDNIGGGIPLAPPTPPTITNLP